MNSLLDVDKLRQKIKLVEAELIALKRQLKQVEASLNANKSHPCPAENFEWKWPLAEIEYKRYGRQMIISKIGIKGQSHPEYHLTDTKIFRSTPTKKFIGPCRRHWWLRVSSGGLFSWCRNRHNRTSRWRCS